jgi:hypothetical protein
VFPFPISPFEPLPQQNAAPLAIAQVCELPEEIAVMFLPANTPVVLTITGTFELMVVPSPSWPVLL